MKHNKRIFILIALVATVLIIFSSCTSVKTSVYIGEEGAGNISFFYGINQNFYDSYLELTGNDMFEGQDVLYWDGSDGNTYVGTIESIEFSSYEELTERLLSLEVGGFDIVDVCEYDCHIFKTVTADENGIHIELNSISEDVCTQNGVKGDEIGIIEFSVSSNRVPTASGGGVVLLNADGIYETTYKFKSFDTNNVIDIQFGHQSFFSQSWYYLIVGGVAAVIVVFVIVAVYTHKSTKRRKNSEVF